LPRLVDQPTNSATAFSFRQLGFPPDTTQDSAVFDLEHFGLADMFRCSAELRRLAVTSSGPQAPVAVVDYLFRNFRRPDTGEPACVLVRLFESRPASPGTIGAASETPQPPRGAELVLAASRGVREEWNDPARSKAHRVIPLHSAEAVARTPMVIALIAQLELP